jgi:hypothetical protein
MVKIPVTGRGGPYLCETSRFQHFPDNRLTDLRAGQTLLEKTLDELEPIQMEDEVKNVLVTYNKFCDKIRGC